MKMQISALFRSDIAAYDPLKPPSKENPGGGVSVLIHHLRQAVPQINIISEVAHAGPIALIDGLWFNGFEQDASQLYSDQFAKRIGEYESMGSYKVLWLTEFEFLRWSGGERDAIFAASDVVCALSKYVQNTASAYHSDVRLLTAPVDVNSVSMKFDKKRRLVSASQVNVEKGIDGLMDIYGSVKLDPEIDLQLGFIGSNDIWGTQNDLRSAIRNLEARLQNNSHYVIPRLSLSDLDRHLENSWGYITNSFYDSFGYAMVSAMLAGCWCFCGPHKLFDERPTAIRFEYSDLAKPVIRHTLSERAHARDEASRQFVHDNYSLDVFRAQFKHLIGGNIDG